MSPPVRYHLLGPLDPTSGSRANLALALQEGQPPRPVVVIWAQDDVVKDSDTRDRLARETARAVVFEHPNILRVHGLVQLPEGLARVTEFADGEPLRRLLTPRRRLPAPLAAQVVADAALGVHYAHVAGTEDGTPLVHGDLRPETLLVAHDGVTKVTGFGALGVAPREKDGRRVKNRRAYAAPEQLLGGRGAMSVGTDVFLLGLVLHECLSGQMPFHGARDHDRAILQDPLPAMRDVPPALDMVVRRATAKRAQDRFLSALALRDALEAAVGTLPGHGAVAQFLETAVPADEPVRAARRRLLEDGLATAVRGAQPAGTGAPVHAVAGTAAATPQGVAGAAAATPQGVAGTASTARPAAGAAGKASPPAPASVPEKAAHPAPASAVEQASLAAGASDRPAPAAPGAKPTPGAPGKDLAAPPKPAEPELPFPTDSAIEVRAAPATTSLESAVGELPTRPPAPSAPAPQVPWRTGHTVPPGAPMPPPLFGASLDPAPREGSRRLAPLALALLAIAAVAALFLLRGRVEGLFRGGGTAALADAGTDAVGAAPVDAGPPVMATVSNGDAGPSDGGALAATEAADGGEALDAGVLAEADAGLTDAGALAAASVDAGATALAPGVLELTSQPALQVALGDRALGRTPLTVTLPAGRHTLQLTNADLGIQTARIVTVPSGGRAAQRVSLEQGSVTVRAPDGAIVTLDGRTVGPTPLKALPVYEGSHHILVTVDQLKWQKSFRVRANERVTFTVDFEE